MRPLLRCALALGLLHASTASLAAPTTAPRTLSGELQGAPWRLDVPADWNGDLVMLAHGYEPVGVPRTTPMAAGDSTAALLGAGYAVAQSAYSSQGWAVAEAITDMEHLRQHALGELKRVRHTWMLGFSMGGAVTIGSLERFPQHYAGGVSLCGANLSGEQIAADLLTTLVAFDYFFPKAEGLPVTGLASREAAMLPQSELYQGIVTALQRDPAHAALLAQRLQVSPMKWPARSACTPWSCTSWPHAAVACRSATGAWSTAASAMTPHSTPGCGASMLYLPRRPGCARRWR